MSHPLTPQWAWDELAAGNARFVANSPKHPNQDAQRRHILEAGQTPSAIFFGCADSRVAAEIIFDQGLGDLFVVRTAGHVVDNAVLGSVEFAVSVLGVPLIVVLGHDSCGALKATMDAVLTGDVPPGYLRDIVERITPSVMTARKDGATTLEELEAEHVRNTTQLLNERSVVVHEAIAAGKLAIVGATYDLGDGRATVATTVGAVTTT
ncbi:carbonic anhydrase [Branchiibius sp. NY16-3462-2]|uniref:carbonic anhydrase n=1 Tax=Branchiibius sp. NY16-3462-2 TaxID=1807500 RepID=UPI00079144F6|nr:carbonic anhydrase [Branchiibius sp. NY16-3462-2]KYH46044.1 carbonic anhydrase [Branchiibius sp. NY16-3462-2]